jgi:glycosyltransferase involved in cell wall biosynthesis
VRLIAYTDTVELGGADLCLAHLLERLEPSIEVTVVGVSENVVERVARARPSASSRVVARPRSGHDARSLLEHLRLFRALEPDIVHASLASPWSCQYAVAAAALARRPRVVAVYQLAVPPVSERQRRAKLLTARAIDRHVGVGERTSREIESLLGLPRNSVRTIHNGVPDELTPSAAREARRRPLLGSIGRLEPQKGVDVLIRALTDVEEADLLVVGDGSERASLEKLAHSIGVSDRVEWKGWSDTPRSYLGTLDVFVLPSRNEGFPLAVLEALLAGTAVVATDVGSVADVIRDGNTGLLVPPEDPAALAEALRRLFADSALAPCLGERGRQVVLDHYTADHMAGAFESLYHDLTG